MVHYIKDRGLIEDAKPRIIGASAPLLDKKAKTRNAPG